MNKKHALRYVITTTALLTMLFVTRVNGETGTVTTETLNLRSEPNTDSSIIELLNEFEELEILGEENGWYRVRHNDNEGYVSAEYVEINEETTQTDPTTTEKGENQTGTTETGSTETPPNETTTTESTETTPNEPTEVTPQTVTLARDASIKILPLINSQQLGTISTGRTVNVISQTNNWLFIETEEITGWIAKNTITQEQTTNEQPQNENPETQTPEEQPEQEQPQEEEPQEEDNQEQNSSETDYEAPQTKYVNASSIYIRTEPSTSSDIITSLIRNTDVTVTGESGDWYKVRYGDFTGYIFKELLSDTQVEETNRGGFVNRNQEEQEEIEETIEEVETNELETNEEEQNQPQPSQTANSSVGEQIVEYAKQYLGCPYVYGGSGPETFDCSGFTMYVYDKFGYTLSHSATAQSRLGIPVEKENLQLGDLVFFLDYETMDGIGHCGIYIGDGNFIHASSGTGYCVKISTLNSGSYLNRYATARRLI